MANEKLKTRPWCPFCGQDVGKASDAIERKMHEFPVGRCQCGAVYSCDATGVNVGSAMVETLVFACDNNWDFAWDLMPEDDYLTGRLENYDERSHSIVDAGNLDGRSARGILYFVRLHTEIADISGRLKKKKDSAADLPSLIAENKPVIEPAPDPKRKKVKVSKKIVKELVAAGDIDSLVAASFDDKKTLRFMQRLLYDPVDENRWYVAWCIGQVCGRVATRDPGQGSQLLHRLFATCSDSAATPWGMIETLGFVIAARPDIFGAFARHLMDYMGDPSTQVQTIWALGEIAAERPDLIRSTPFYTLFHFLKHENPAVRGHIARLLGRINAGEALMQLMEIGKDDAEITIWEDGKFNKTTVGEEARKAIALIQEGEQE